MGSFDVLERVGEVAYQLALPPNMITTHDVLYISILKKYIINRSHKIDCKDLKIKDDMLYIEKLVKILNRKEAMLRTKTI